MTRALIIGASGGIGAAMLEALEARGVSCVGLSRSRDGLDLTDPASVEAALSAVSGPFDLIVVATGALAIEGGAPEKTMRAVSGPAMMQQFAVNAVGPALIMAHLPRLLVRDRRAVFAVLSARVGSIGDNRLGGWVSYRAAKAALNQIVHTGAIEMARRCPGSISVCLHPGTVATPFTRDYLGRHPSTSPQEAAQNLLGVIDGLTPQDNGGFFDWAGKPVPW